MKDFRTFHTFDSVIIETELGKIYSGLLHSYVRKIPTLHNEKLDAAALYINGQIEHITTRQRIATIYHSRILLIEKIKGDK